MGVSQGWLLAPEWVQVYESTHDGCPPVAMQGWLRDPVTVRVGARMRIPSTLQVKHF